MFNKTNYILLYCLLSIMLKSISAMENANDDDPGGYVVRPNLLLVGVVTDPQSQYEVGLNLINSLNTMRADQKIPHLRDVVKVLTLSANGNCEDAKKILPAWQHNLAALIFESSHDLALDQQITNLREVYQLIKLSTEGGDAKAKLGLPKIQYSLGHALFDSVLPNATSLLNIEPLQEIINLLSLSGTDEAKKDLPSVKFCLGCLLLKSVVDLDSEKKIDICTKAIEMLQAYPKSQMHVHLAQYHLATAYHDKSKKTPEEQTSLFKKAFGFLTMSAEGGHKPAQFLLPSWQQGLAPILANSADELPLEQRTSNLREAVALLNKSSSADPQYRNNFHIVQNNLASHLIVLSLGRKPEERSVLLTEARN